MAVVLHVVALVLRREAVEELAGQIVDEFLDLCLLPRVLALVEVDGVLDAVEELSDRPGSTVDSFHGVASCATAREGGRVAVVGIWIWPVTAAVMRAWRYSRRQSSWPAAFSVRASECCVAVET